jgi:hypothetical protein
VSVRGDVVLVPDPAGASYLALGGALDAKKHETETFVGVLHHDIRSHVLVLPDNAQCATDALAVVVYLFRSIR